MASTHQSRQPHQKNPILALLLRWTAFSSGVGNVGWKGWRLTARLKCHHSLQKKQLSMSLTSKKVKSLLAATQKTHVFFIISQRFFRNDKNIWTGVDLRVYPTIWLTYTCVQLARWFKCTIVWSHYSFCMHHSYENVLVSRRSTLVQVLAIINKIFILKKKSFCFRKLGKIKYDS